MLCQNLDLSIFENPDPDLEAYLGVPVFGGPQLQIDP